METGEAMTARTYYAVTAEERLAEAQRVVDRHVTSSATGLRLACGIPALCPERERAVAIFFRALRPPLRRPGATRPELVSARRVA
jgi:hypothetical protein